MQELGSNTISFCFRVRIFMVLIYASLPRKHPPVVQIFSQKNLANEDTTEKIEKGKQSILRRR